LLEINESQADSADYYFKGGLMPIGWDSAFYIYNDIVEG